MKGGVEERPKKLANAIYDEGIGAFGEVTAKGKKKKWDNHGESRREGKIKHQSFGKDGSELLKIKRMVWRLSTKI